MTRRRTPARQWKNLSPQWISSPCVSTSRTFSPFVTCDDEDLIEFSFFTPLPSILDWIWWRCLRFEATVLVFFLHHRNKHQSFMVAAQTPGLVFVLAPVPPTSLTMMLSSQVPSSPRCCRMDLTCSSATRSLEGAKADPLQRHLHLRTSGETPASLPLYLGQVFGFEYPRGFQSFGDAPSEQQTPPGQVQQNLTHDLSQIHAAGQLFEPGKGFWNEGTWGWIPGVCRCERLTFVCRG